METPKARYYEGKTIVHDEKESNRIHQSGYIGKPLSEGKLSLSDVEALYLLEEGKIQIFGERGDELDFEKLSTELSEKNPKFMLKYRAYQGLRSCGYVVKTGLKYGAHFRVYGKEKGLGEEHSPYLVHAIKEDDVLTPQNLSRFVRLAHSVRKKMIFAVVDDEGDITYYSLTRETP